MRLVGFRVVGDDGDTWNMTRASEQLKMQHSIHGVSILVQNVSPVWLGKHKYREREKVERQKNGERGGKERGGGKE